MDDYTLLHGDCLEEMAGMDAGSVDAVVCDPPYGLEFMGKEWDKLDSPYWPRNDKPFTYRPKGGVGPFDKPRPRFGKDPHEMQAWHTAWATEAYRVLKPSHYLLAFGGTRTWHRLACAIEDAGFEIRDTLMWLYGSGFPKGKASLKPAWEPIILARKPGPMRELGIESCRIKGVPHPGGEHGVTIYGADGNYEAGPNVPGNASGRWPANLILECTCDETREGTAKGNASTDKGTGLGYGGGHASRGGYVGTTSPNGKEPVRIHTDPNCPCAMLDGQTGTLKTHPGTCRSDYSAGMYGADRREGEVLSRGDSGGASRFFYCAKASRSERNAGCEGMEAKRSVDDDWVSESRKDAPGGGIPTPQSNHHPTVKPLALMRWLVKLVARPGDVVVDPFAGSGTTGVACAMEGREFIGIERELDYLEIARRRIEHASAQGRLPLDESPPLGLDATS